MEKGNLLESLLPNPIRTSEVWRYRADAIHEDQAEWTSGCKIQSTFCWPCSMPQEKGGPLIQTLTSDSRCAPIIGAGPFFSFAQWCREPSAFPTS